MKKNYALPLFLASILIVAFAAVAGSGRNGSDLPAPPAIGTTIDDFKLPDADGAEHSLKSLTGKNGELLAPPNEAVGTTSFFVTLTNNTTSSQNITGDVTTDERQALPLATEDLATRLVSQISEGW